MGTDYLPDYQRGACAFIDAQIAHLDAQRARLVAARDYLASLTPAVGTPPALPAAPPTAPPPPVFLRPDTLPAELIGEVPSPVSAESRIAPFGRASAAEMTEVERRVFVLLSDPGYLPDRIGRIAARINADVRLVSSCMHGRGNLFESVGSRSAAVWRLRDPKGNAELPSDYERVRRALADGPLPRSRLRETAGMSDARLSDVLNDHDAVFQHGSNGYELVAETENLAG